MKTQESTRQRRSDDHPTSDTKIRKLVAVAHSHAAGSDPAHHSQELYSTVKQAREILTTLENDYGLNPAFLTTPLPSNQAIAEEWRETHNGEEPSEGTVFREVAKRARESLSRPKVHREPADAIPLSKPVGHAIDDSELAMVKKVEQKLGNTAGYPTMSVEEACHSLGRSKSTIYRWLDEGKLSWSGSPGRVKTTSVKRLLDSPSE